MEQLAFDFDEFAREDARARLPEWAGAPLHYTEDYYPPRLLDEAFEHWRFINGSFGSFARSHMWHRFSHATVEFGEHRALVRAREWRDRVVHLPSGCGQAQHRAALVAFMRTAGHAPGRGEPRPDDIP